jgi:ATP-dependent DNA helicase RecG
MRIARQESTLLKRLGAIEGRYPNLCISSKVAFKTGDQASYIKNKAFDDAYYKDLIVKMIDEMGSANFKELSELR